MAPSIDHHCLLNLLNIEKQEQLAEKHKIWITDALKNANKNRDSRWSKSIAVGDKAFVNNVKNRLGYRAIGRKAIESQDTYHLQEEQTGYGLPDNPEDNTFLWNDNI